MSTDRHVDSQDAIEQTKQQIRGLVGEIAQLVKSDLDSDEFYAAFMQRIVSALAAAGGAVWLVGEGGEMKVNYQINLQGALLDDDDEEGKKHKRLLSYVAQSGEPQLVPPHSSFGDDGTVANPTEHLLVLAPMHGDDSVEGIVEIFQRPDSQPATQRGYLRFLVQMCELAAEWIKSRKLKQFSDRHSLWAQADQFSRLVHQNLDLRETAYTIANEGRRLIGADRVTVAVRRGEKCRVEAVSGQDTVENRSNSVALLGKLATRVMLSGEPLRYHGSTEDLPPQIEEVIDAYVDESYAKSIIVLPLRRPERPEEANPENIEQQFETSESLDDCIGALIIEQIETNLPAEVIDPRIDLVHEHSCRAISNALTYNNIFLMPLWRAVGSLRWLVRARTLPKTITISALVLVFLAVMVFYRVDFYVESRGVLQPVVRRQVFVRANGIVEGFHCGDQDTVRAGDLLATLMDRDLQIERRRIDGELQETIDRLAAARRTQFQSGLSSAERIRISGQILQLKQRLDTLRQQLVIIKQKEKDLEIRSPIDGTVVMQWEVEKSLSKRPVVIGQVLMTVVDTTQKWELELSMSERRIGHVNRARMIKETGAEGTSELLGVRYVLATHPENQFTGTTSGKDIGMATRVEGDEGPIVPIRVAIDEQVLKGELAELQIELRPGATVTAEIHCGKAAIGYTWFHEAIQWVQLHLLF
jgi:multidrug efflux pump subunit AcrA (membrane-fusion protein)